MTDKIRILVAGAGLFGREHLRLLAGRDDVAIVGIADAVATSAEAAATTFGAAAFDTDTIALFDRTRPDGIVVATPGETHFRFAAHALRAGVPVLLEKPVGVSAAEAMRLAEEEAASRAFVLPGHVLRFSPSHRLLADIARGGGIGRVLSVTSRRHRDDSHARRYPEIDPILMTMIHDIDLAVWLTGGGIGEAFAIRAPSGPRSVTTLTARGAGGAAWHLTTAWTYPGACPADRVEVVGETGGVELEVGAFLRRYGATEERIDIGGEAWDDSLREEQAAFIEAIRGGRRPTAVTVADAITGLVAAEAAMASIATGGIVRT